MTPARDTPVLSKTTTVSTSYSDIYEPFAHRRKGTAISPTHNAPVGTQAA